MPNSDRSRSAFAVCDTQLSDRAARRGLSVTAARVQRWRLNGLLPSPEVQSRRPRGAPPGRLPRVYSDEQAKALDDLVDELHWSSRRGRPTADLALILFARRLPVDVDLVRQAIDRRLENLQQAADVLLSTALAKFPPPKDPEWASSPGFDQADALAQLAMESPSSFGPIRKNLRAAGLPSSRTDTLSVITRLLAAVMADATTDHDADELMYAMGLHGLREPVGEEGPVVMEDDPSAFLDAAQAVTQSILRPLPEDLANDELVQGRDLVIDVTRVLASFPDPSLLHHLGGPHLVEVWDPNDLDRTAVTISGAVSIRRVLGPLDASPLLAAVHENGWSTLSRDEFARIQPSTPSVPRQ